MAVAKKKEVLIKCGIRESITYKIDDLLTIHQNFIVTANGKYFIDGKYIMQIPQY